MEIEQPEQALAVPVAQPKPKPRCMVYVDGYNMYYGVLKAKPAWKWLNLQSLFEGLRPREEVIGIKYCTAVIDPKKSTSPTRERQAVYLRALATLPKVQIIYGTYQLRDAKCRADSCGEYKIFQNYEEKKTDVNIAVEMVCDAIDGKMDLLVLVSADSDQEPAITMIRKRFPGIKIIVYRPVLPNAEEDRVNHYYGTIGVPSIPLPLGAMPGSQFPNPITAADGSKIVRPSEWA